ncbi:hypothetical protein QR680_010833 [Steinernema hermaphroditum]|uniref:G-protein coupled receptors family 1 profile domain-containing protein n=1 Tax=Steinernema hermaphroditum TaxID=289476 RepID=A0AA39ISP8_9BILA|nr:hypothetical protein QR680_010833 [Steinernema hermaphroditum]
MAFFTYELYTVLMTSTSIIFFVVSIVGSYLIVYKTPDTIAAYKYYFLFLNSAYQFTIFLIGIFGWVDIQLSSDGLICLFYSGIIQLFPRNVIYPEVFSTLLGLGLAINTVFLPFLYRYCHVCHPKSFYCTNPMWPRAINVVLSISTSFLLALPATLHVYLYKLDSHGYSEKDLVVCFPLGPVLFGWACMTAAYIVIIVMICFIFTYRVVRTLKWQMVQASKRTKDMQRTLTITLLVSVLIPTILAMLPVLLALYLIASKADHTEYLTRTVYVSCVLEGLLNIICTIVLVKPYRDVLRSWVRLKKSETVVSVVPKIT